MKPLWLLLGAACLAVSGCSRSGTPAATEIKVERVARNEEDVKALRDKIKHLESLTPDQAAIMSHLAYHWANLWFAIDQDNWPLADFYLGETRSNLKWAVRAKPVRKGADGKEFDLRVIQEGLDKSQFAQLKEAIKAQDKPKCQQLYQATLSLCYACHKTADKPYLRPQLPRAPEARMINFDPAAKEPQ